MMTAYIIQAHRDSRVLLQTFFEHGGNVQGYVRAKAQRIQTLLPHRFGPAVGGIQGGQG